jgi:hypothetical protein
MIYRRDIEQNSEDWFAIKIGKFSASSCAELLMDKKTKGYTGLIDRIIEERITGQPSESKTFSGNTFTERGMQLEPIAREDYELRHFATIELIGVVELNDWILCSPDGLIGDDGLYQAKCPIFNTQREYLKTLKVPGNYYKQMQFELFVTGREYNIFNSYHPYLPPVDIIVERDEAMIREIDQRLSEAIAEVTSEINYLKSLK